MQKIINIVQIVVGVLLITAILLQSRGSGLSAVFGGAGDVYRTKRGLEKIIFIGTIILAVVFLGLGVVNIIIAS
jgi:preprotein translocase subunit SecG